METNQITFDFSRVSPAFQLCFLSDCPRCGECLRYMAGQHLPEKLTWGPAVYPTMKRDEKGCRLFKTGQTKHMAWGFKTLFSEVKSKDNTPLRTAMKAYLGGHGTYYRYHSGDKKLTPEQQAWIIKLFRQLGYQTNLEFDHYADVYDFDH